MTELRVPVKEALRKVVSDAAVARMWSRIEARERTAARRIVQHTTLAIPVVALAIAIAVVVAWRRAPAGDRVGALLVNGTSWAPVQAHMPESLALSDGSHITMMPGSFVEPLGNSADAVVLRQGAGIVTYDIAPHGPRRWTIECGAASVEVVGTNFVIDRDDHHVRVDVMRGVVLVRGARVPDHVLRLTAGMYVNVAADEVAPSPPALASSSSASVVPPVPSAPAPVAAVTTPSGKPFPVRETWRELAARGANAAAYTKLGAGGVAAAAGSASVEELFGLADVARLSGHVAEAVVPLERILDDHADDARASLAGLTLGRIELRSLDRPALAARALQRAMAIGLPADLAEDASALAIEAMSRAGDRYAARAAYRRFIAQFPASSLTHELQPWIEP